MVKYFPGFCFFVISLALISCNSKGLDSNSKTFNDSGLLFKNEYLDIAYLKGLNPTYRIEFQSLNKKEGIGPKKHRHTFDLIAYLFDGTAYKMDSCVIVRARGPHKYYRIPNDNDEGKDTKLGNYVLKCSDLGNMGMPSGAIYIVLTPIDGSGDFKNYVQFSIGFVDKNFNVLDSIGTYTVHTVDPSPPA